MKSLPKLALLVPVLVLLTPMAAYAQAYYYDVGTYPWTSPIPVAGGYVDAANGNLHIEIPIASMPQRGHIPFVAKLVYDSHFWQTVTVNNSTQWQPTNVGGWGGWRLMTSAGTGGGAGATESQGGTCVQVVNHQVHYTPFYKFTNWTWTAPDGHQIPFNTVETVGLGSVCGTYTPSSNGIASDASGYHLYVTNYTNAVVYAPDGTQVAPNVKDTNGNYYSEADGYGDVIDTLGREPITTTVNGSTTTYAVLNSQDGTSNFVVTTEPIPVSTAFGQSNVTEYSGNITVIESITLPDGNTYQFNYDQGSTAGHYGALTGMTLPTGGSASYGYTNFQDAYKNQNIWTTSYSLNGGAWSFSPQVTQNCGSSCGQNCTTCTQQLTATAPTGEYSVYAFNLNTGAWNTSIKSYDTTANGNGLLQTVTKSWNFTNLPYVVPTGVSTTLPTPSGGSVTKSAAYTFDTSNFGNITRVDETGFNSVGARTTEFTYLTNSNNNMVNKKTVAEICTTGCPNGTYLDETVVTYDGTATSSMTGVINHDDTNFGTSYTPRGNPTQIQHVYYGTTVTNTLAYDMTGQVTSSTDNNGNITKFSYADNYFKDSSNGPTAATPAGKTNAFVTQLTLPAPFNWTVSSGYYLGTSQLAKKTDQNGVTSTFDYLDPYSRPTQSVTPINSTQNSWQVVNYTSASTADSYLGITDANPSLTCTYCRHDQSNLDTFGRAVTQVLVSDPEGADTVTTSYDSASRLASVTNPERTVSNTTDGSDSYTYDGLGRTIKVTHSDGSSSLSYYGAAVASGGGIGSQLCAAGTYGLGYPVLVVNEAGRKRQVWTDGFGRNIEVDEQDNSGNLTLNTCYSYDPLNNLVGVTQGSQTRSYSYIPTNGLLTATTPESGTMHYSYLTNRSTPCSGNPGFVCERTDARSTQATYTYDQLNRLNGITYSDSTPAVTFTYDGGTNQKGFLTGMTDGSGSTTWTYNEAGWVTSEQRTIAGIVKTTSYAYNGDGSIASITYPSGRTITYSVSNAQRTLTAKDVANNIQYAMTASYVPPGALSSVIYGPATGFNGITQTASYNSRLETTTVAASSSAGTAQSLGFSYSLPGGNDGTITGVTNNVNTGLTESFTYDSLDRILTGVTSSSAANGCWGQSYGPAGPPPPGPPDDRFSNLTEINVAQCVTGQLNVTVNTATNQISAGGYAYDAAGNTTIEGGSGTYTYTYDAENRLTSAVGPGTNGYTYCYVYDGNGLRVEKLHISAGTCAAPQNPTVDMLYWRSTAGATIAETDGSGNLKSEYVFFDGERIARRDGVSGNVYYYYFDQVGSTAAVTDGSGNLCYQATFTPYGEEHATQAVCSQNYKFTGYERDAETGLDYAFARYYDSRLGRFLSADPLAGAITDPQSLNRYAYVGNRAGNFTDPSGMLLPPCPKTDMGCDEPPDIFALPPWLGGFGLDDGSFGGWSDPPPQYDGSFSGQGLGIAGSSFISLLDLFDFPFDSRGGVGDINIITGMSAVAAGCGINWSLFGFACPTGGGVPDLTIAQVRRIALKQAKLKGCIQKYFPGEGFGPKTAPKAAVVPAATIANLTGSADNVATYTPNGTVLFSSVYWTKPANSADLWATAYVHEWGNIMSKNAYGDPTALQGMLGPNDPSFPNDPDSGSVFEYCVYGTTSGYKFQR